MSTKAQRRSDAQTIQWRLPAAPFRLSEDRFRLTAVQGKNTRALGDLVTAVSWDDVSMELTGSLSLTGDPRAALKLSAAHKVRCEWAPGRDREMRRLWTLAVQNPARQRSDETWEVELASTLTVSRRSRDDYRFRRGKSHPKGWRAHEIAREVARRQGWRIGVLAETTHYIRNLNAPDSDPVDVIVKAYRAERRATGRKFFLAWDGRLNIYPLRRSKHLLLLAGSLIDASYRQELREDFATALTVRATGKPSGAKRKKRKIVVKLRSQEGVRTIGYVHRSVTAEDADTEAEARKYGERLLARVSTPKRELEVTLPLVPSIRRGDAFKVDWRSAGLTQVVYVASASHQATPGGGTTTLVAVFDDPFRDTKADKAAKARADKARQRERVPEAPGEDPVRAAPKPAKAARRSGV